MTAEMYYELSRKETATTVEFLCVGGRSFCIESSGLVKRGLNKMLKKIMLGVSFVVLSTLAIGAATQSSISSANTVPTRTPVVGETVPTRTPTVSDTIPTRTPVPDAPILQISNFVDFAPGIPEIIIKLNGEELVQLSYGDSSENIYVPVGTYLMEIVAVTGDTRAPEDFLLAFANVTFELEKEYSAIIGGDDGSNQPAQIKIVEDDNSAPAAGKAKIRIAHFAPVDSDLANTAVDVVNEGTNTIFGGLSGVQFGAVSSFIEVDSGVAYDLVVRNGSGIVVDLDPITLSNGEIVTIVVNGGGANQPIDAGVISNLEKSFLPVIFE